MLDQNADYMIRSSKQRKIHHYQSFLPLKKKDKDSVKTSSSPQKLTPANSFSHWGERILELPICKVIRHRPISKQTLVKKSGVV